jgi:hypothetical protein
VHVFPAFNLLNWGKAYENKVRIKPLSRCADLSWWGLFVLTPGVPKMKCPKCQFENEEGFEFCGKCGQPLQDFAEVEKVVPEFKGERKHVTVLFSDLSGYTSIS